MERVQAEADRATRFRRIVSVASGNWSNSRQPDGNSAEADAKQAVDRIFSELAKADKDRAGA